MMLEYTDRCVPEIFKPSEMLRDFLWFFWGENYQETLTRFQVGSSFSGEQAMGGAFTAVASWVEAHGWMGWGCVFSAAEFLETARTKSLTNQLAFT